jgi:hypothetical protein
MKAVEKLEAWFAVVLIILFLLPWLSFGGLSMSGLSMMGDLSKGGNVPFEVTMLNIAWLIPILSIATIVMAVMGMDTKIVGIATGVVAILSFILLFLVLNKLVEGSNQSALGLIGFGAYLTLLAGIGMIVAALGIIKSPMKASASTMQNPSS